MSETTQVQASNNGTTRVKGKPGRKPGTQVKRAAGLGTAAPSMAATGLGAPIRSSAVGRDFPVIASLFTALPAKGPWSVEEACGWLQIAALSFRQAYGMTGHIVVTVAKAA